MEFVIGPFEIGPMNPACSLYPFWREEKSDWPIPNLALYPNTRS